ncbi:hypothetical protein [Trichothermofontia sp.]
MPSADLWLLAQQGNPQALETVFKMQNPEPTWVIKVRLQDNCLQVLLEAEPTPEKQRAVALVQGFLAHLQPLALTSAQTVRIWGRQRGQLLADWREDIELAAFLKTQPEPPPTPIAVSEDFTQEPEPARPLSAPASSAAAAAAGLEPEAVLETRVTEASSDQPEPAEPGQELESVLETLVTEVLSDPPALTDIQPEQVGTAPLVAEALNEPSGLTESLLPEEPEGVLASLSAELEAIESGLEPENGVRDRSDPPDLMGLGLEPEGSSATPAQEPEATGAVHPPEIDNRLADLAANPASLFVSGAALLSDLMPAAAPETAPAEAVAEALRGAERDLENPSLSSESRAEAGLPDREVEAVTADRDTVHILDDPLEPISDEQTFPITSPPPDVTDDMTDEVADEVADDEVTDDEVTDDLALEGQALELHGALETEARDWEPAGPTSAAVAAAEAVVAMPSAIVPPRSPQDGAAAEDEAEWFLRPEIVVVVLFALFVIIWQTYEAILEEVDSSDASLSSSALARRLNTTRRTINRLKKQSDFAQWSQSRDPDGIAWVYGENGRFSPVLTPTLGSE